MSECFRPSRRIVVLGLVAAGIQAAWAEDLPEVVATKDPSCGCCEAWVKHLRNEGFRVQIVNAPVNPIKAKLGVPRELASCHTAQVGGYVAEGHVPASAIKRLLAEKPSATGLAVPGMPVGSPGMEVAGMEPASYEVVLFGPAGRSTFARFRGAQPI
ncbi:DUF411 domain-containing protein [Methylorubrum thiocyanatum]|uniref:DUF411 domain-containing protein n=1 Tax=Methylorubrum thiocyanatum TaxID=47958 RepID=UPI0035C83EDE